MTPKQKKPALARLGFGEASALEFTTAQATADYLSRTVQNLRGLYKNGGEFSCRMSALLVNRQAFIASSTTSYSMDFDEAPGCRFVMNLSGSLTDNSLRLAPRSSVIFSNEEAHSSSRTGSVIAADIDRSRIESIAKSMLGDSGSRTVLDLSKTRLIDPRIGGVHFDRAIESLLSLLDSYALQPKMLRLLNVDEAFYRLLATFIRPDLFLAEDFHGHHLKTNAIDSVCDAVNSRIDEPLTMTEMEAISGLGVRALQYAFKKKFGCSPMEWQRRQRLQLARRRLYDATAGVSISEIAVQTGFSSPSRFAELYKRKFGETPRETLNKSKQKVARGDREKPEGER
jgi:AraC-like DNA-binding protein